jgi:hypothetical protein
MTVDIPVLILVTMTVDIPVLILMTMTVDIPVLTLVTDCWHTCIDTGDWLLTYLYWHWWLILLTYLYWHWWLTVDISVLVLVTMTVDIPVFVLVTMTVDIAVFVLAGDYDCWHTCIDTGYWLLTYLYWHWWLTVDIPVLTLVTNTVDIPILTLVTDCWHICIWHMYLWLLIYLYWYWWLWLLIYLNWHWWLIVDIPVLAPVTMIVFPSNEAVLLHFPFRSWTMLYTTNKAATNMYQSITFNKSHILLQITKQQQITNKTSHFKL